MFKSISGNIVVAICLILSLIWISWGILIFFYQPSDYEWSRGEIGDFVGGGLGGIAVFAIIYTLWIQIKQIKVQQDQIKNQQNETFEAGVFRIFEGLKPEVEGLSVRIISKVLKANLVKASLKDFETMLEKYHTKDRTVFLRTMQKSEYCMVIKQGQADKDLNIAITRFLKIMKLLKNSLNQTTNKTDRDFAEAIKSTEIYQTFEKCFPEIANS
jgi:hypothetical protein